jgi:hypothetical protein
MATGAIAVAMRFSSDRTSGCTGAGLSSSCLTASNSRCALELRISVKIREVAMSDSITITILVYMAASVGMLIVRFRVKADTSNPD